MGHDLLQVFRVQGVQDVEEVLSGRALVLGVLGREELDEGGILLEVGPEIPHGELVVEGDFDVLDISFLEQLLLVGEDLLQEVLGDDALVGQVEL